VRQIASHLFDAWSANLTRIALMGYSLHKEGDGIRSRSTKFIPILGYAFARKQLLRKVAKPDVEMTRFYR
jgi:hypothetical protein